MTVTADRHSDERPTRSFSERVVEVVASRLGPDRRGFLRGATLGGAALATAPWTYLTRPASAYDRVCGTHSSCSSGYTVFCCTINAGQNVCPPNTFIGGWWKADNASLCGGGARYYVDCNAFRNDNTHLCRCNDDPGTCDNRLVACNQFRYGQCNTQIPASDTGPVVCRTVSCTPPWQEFAGVCSSASRTDNNTVTHSAPCLNGNVPFGSLDTVTTDGTSVRLRGWAVDRDEPSRSLDVAVYQDGVGLAWYRTTVVRPDVNTAHGVSGAHGFDVTLTAAVGTRTFTVYAINVGTGSSNPAIGSRTVQVHAGRTAQGYLERADGLGGRVRLTGWAFDRDDPSASLSVDVYRDGARVGRVRADRPRPDVNSAFAITGAHGFDVTVPAPDGRRRFAAYAIDTGPDGPGNPLIGLRDVDVDGRPRGSFDSATADVDEVRLRGWAYDPDDPGRSIDVAIYVDGTGLSRFRADRPRPDVNRSHGILGDHGFDVVVRLARGVHDVTVYAIDVPGDRPNPLVGRRSVAVQQGSPLGALDELTTSGTTVRLRGWALDPDVPAAEIDVDVYVDGRPAGRFRTGRPRSDVNRAYGTTGDHGFDVGVAVARGSRLVHVYALGVDGQNPLIASRQVRV